MKHLGTIASCKNRFNGCDVNTCCVAYHRICMLHGAIVLQLILQWLCETSCKINCPVYHYFKGNTCIEKLVILRSCVRRVFVLVSFAWSLLKNSRQMFGNYNFAKAKYLAKSGVVPLQALFEAQLLEGWSHFSSRIVPMGVKMISDQCDRAKFVSKSNGKYFWK